VCRGAFAHTVTAMRDVEVINSERQLVAALRRAARERVSR
jgi:hypothetical protein